MLIKSKTSNKFVTDNKNIESSSTVIDRNKKFPISGALSGMVIISYNRPP